MHDPTIHDPCVILRSPSLHYCYEQGNLLIPMVVNCIQTIATCKYGRKVSAKMCWTWKTKFWFFKLFDNKLQEKRKW